MDRMIKVLTRSGATYLIDDQLMEICRLEGPFSPDINYKTAPDGLWRRFTRRSTLRLGAELIVRNETGPKMWARMTTPVVNIEWIDTVVGDKLYADSMPPSKISEALNTLVEDK